MPTRPASVTVVVALLGVSSLVYVLGALVSLFLWWQPGDGQLEFGKPVSDWFWILTAILFVSLGIVLALVARSAWTGDAGGGIAVSLLCLLGVGFSLFALTEGFGWFILVSSLAILIANQTRSAQAWYRASR